MKRQFLLLFAIAVFATAVTTNAFGQTGKTLTANVQFDFQIGDRTYPAGEYQFESISQTGNVLLLRNVGDANNNRILLAGYSNAGKGQTPKLVFQKYGKTYFLTHIVFDSGQWRYSIHPSRRQRETETTLASRLPRTN